MSVETPPPADPAAPTRPTGRRCPRCGAGMTEQQEWCLNCGAAVGTRIVSAPGWRTPIAIAAALLVLAAIAVAIAIVELADDTGEVAQTPPAATPTPPPPATPTVTPEASLTPDPALPEASAKDTPEATATPESGPGPADAEWPAGKSGWTVVLASDTSESDAQRKADGFASDGIPGVGILHSDDYSSLQPGSWIVFTGVYESQSEASDGLDGVDVRDAYIRRIQPD